MKQNKPITISVTIPVHNTAEFLPKCLDSLQAQTYPYLEVVCVDDGSTDGSLDILQAYAARDERFKVYHQEAQGVSAARNTALLHSTGDFITSLDSDDYIHPELYQKAVSLITPEVDLVCFGIQCVDVEGKSLPDHDGYYEMGYEGTRDFRAEMTERINVCIWSKLWRKSIIDERNIQFPVGLVHEDDALFYMYAPFVRKAAFLQDVGYYYVQRSGSIMHSGRKTIADAEQYLGILRYVHRFYQTHGIDSLQGGYFLRQFGRSYHLVERYCPPAKRNELAAMFRELAAETGLVSAHSGDQRLRCLHRPGKLARFFIRRRSDRTQYRLGPFPLASRRYKNGKFTGWRFDAWHALRTLVRHCLPGK